LFLPNDQVKILFCPEAQELNGEQATTISVSKPSSVFAFYNNKDMDANFKPTDWEKTNAYWLVKHNVSGRIVVAFVRHIITIGDLLVVGKTEPGWRELEGKVMRLETIQARRYGIRANGLSVLLEDIRPKQMTKSPESVDSGISKEDIVAAAIEVVGADNLQDTEIGELLDKLGISLADDADLTVSTYVDISFRLDVNYPKGIELGDKTAVAQALATKLKALSTSELVDFFLENLGDVEA